MSPLFEINYHTLPYSKTIEKINFNICLQSVNSNHHVERFQMTTRWRYSVFKNNETAASCVNASFSLMNLHKL